MVFLVGGCVAVGLGGEAFAQEGDPESIGWLAGCWLADQGGGNTVEEQWSVPGGGMLLGLSRTVRPGRDTAFEFLRVHVRNGVLVYTAVPSGQASADFTAEVVTADRVRFVNADHDFPQAIEYRRAGPDALEALVFATVGADVPAFSLAYRRKGCERELRPGMADAGRISGANGG